jgi:hypothetical protein
LSPDTENDVPPAIESAPKEEEWPDSDRDEVQR